MASGPDNGTTTSNYDVREISFQNVIDKVFKPSGVKVGGFPEELFLDLSDEEFEKYKCNICYLIVNDCRQCDNGHFFCNTCALAWSLTYGENSLKCSFCRCSQAVYACNADVDGILSQKRVKCLEKGCAFQSTLRVFLIHNHGKLPYSNVGVDFDALRRQGQTEASLNRFPTLYDLSDTSESNSLSRGGWMLNQMMMLMHLEAQLRQHSLLLLESAAGDAAAETEPSTEAREGRERHRNQRLEDIISLNEQLNEVGSILSSFLGASFRSTTAQASRSTNTSGILFQVQGAISSTDEDRSSSENSSIFGSVGYQSGEAVHASAAQHTLGINSSNYMRQSTRENIENFYDIDSVDTIDWDSRSDITVTDTYTVVELSDVASIRDESSSTLSSSSSYDNLSSLTRNQLSSRRSVTGSSRFEATGSSTRDPLSALELDEDEERYFFDGMRRRNRGATSQNAVSANDSESSMSTDSARTYLLPAQNQLESVHRRHLVIAQQSSARNSVTHYQELLNASSDSIYVPGTRDLGGARGNNSSRNDDGSSSASYSGSARRNSSHGVTLSPRVSRILSRVSESRRSSLAEDRRPEQEVVQVSYGLIRDRNGTVAVTPAGRPSLTHESSTTLPEIRNSLVSDRPSQRSHAQGSHRQHGGASADHNTNNNNSRSSVENRELNQRSDDFETILSYVDNMDYSNETVVIASDTVTHRTATNQIQSNRSDQTRPGVSLLGSMNTVNNTQIISEMGNAARDDLVNSMTTDSNNSMISDDHPGLLSNAASNTSHAVEDEAASNLDQAGGSVAEAAGPVIVPILYRESFETIETSSNVNKISRSSQFDAKSVVTRNKRERKGTLKPKEKISGKPKNIFLPINNLQNPRSQQRPTALRISSIEGTSDRDGLSNSREDPLLSRRERTETLKSKEKNSGVPKSTFLPINNSENQRSHYAARQIPAIKRATDRDGMSTAREAAQLRPSVAHRAPVGQGAAMACGGPVAQGMALKPGAKPKVSHKTNASDGSRSQASSPQRLQRHTGGRPGLEPVSGTLKSILPRSGAAGKK